MKYEKWSFGYFLLKGYIKFSHRLIHRKIIVNGKEKLPVGKPVVFAPNHQNALCDPLAVLCNLPYQPVWLARADLFKKKIVRNILQFFKMIPVYRIRDGKENLKNNEKTFSDSIKVLENNFALALFPEAAHSGRRHMIPHKKAIPRIVFMAEEKTNFNLDIQIVPVGIFYSHYWKFDRLQIVNIGDPVPVREFEEQFRESQHSATIALRKRIFDEILPLTVDFRTKQYYEEFEMIREIYRKKFLINEGVKFSNLNLFKSDQKIASILDELENKNHAKTIDVCKEVSAYMSMVKGLKLRDWLIDKKQNTIFKFIVNLFLLIAGLPIFIYGALFNVVPFVFLDKIIRKKVKNIVFWSTFFFVGGIILFPIIYLIELAFISFLLPGLWLKIIFLISLPLTGKLAFKWYIQLRKFIGRLRLLNLKVLHKKEFEKLFLKKRIIIEDLDNILSTNL